MKYIYKITNIHNNKVYIGQTKNFNKRRKEHLMLLRNGRHNKNMQQDYNTYGEDSFIFEVIDTCDNEDCLDREDYWIEYYGGIGSNNTYNVASQYHKNKQSYRSLSLLYKGKTHKEIYGEERALHMSRLNSEKHKGKCPANKGKTKAEFFGEESAKRQALANSLAHKG